MQLKITKIDGKYSLAINPDDSTALGAWKRLEDLKGLKDEDIQFLLRTPSTAKDGSIKGNSSVEKTLIGFCQNYNIDYPTAQSLIRSEYDALISGDAPIIEPETRHTEAIIPFEEVVAEHLSFEEEVMACIVLAAKTPAIVNCKPSIFAVGPSGTGKSETMNLFNAPDLMNWIGRSTEHAWIPGRPNAEVERTPGIFERSDHRCICVNECGNFANEFHAEKVMGEMADILTMGFTTLSDPVEDVNIQVDCTAIFGMTYYTYKKLQEKSLGIGQRFLVFKTSNNRKGYLNSAYLVKETKRPKSYYVNLVRTAALREMPSPSIEIIKRAHSFAQYIMDLCSVGIKFKKGKKDAMGSGRLGDQIVYLTQLRAMIYNRTPTVDDVDFFLPLMVNMIPHGQLWKDILKQIPANIPVEKVETELEIFGDGMQILESVEKPLNFMKMKDDWYDFFETIEEML